MEAEMLGKRYYNEAFGEDGETRELYKPLLEARGLRVLEQRHEAANRKLRELGATFTLPDERIEDRILPTD